MELERDAIDRLGDAVASAKLHLQLIDLEQESVDRLPHAPGIEDLNVGLSTGPDCDCHADLLSAISDRGRRERRRPA